MNVAALINLPNDAEKTNLIYQNLVVISFQKKFNLNIEVNGLMNDETKLTAENLDEAEIILIITDEEYIDQRFEDKKVLTIKSDEAAYNTEVVYEKILKELGFEELPKPEEIKVEEVAEVIEEVEKKVEVEKKTIYSHLTNGTNAIIPLLITGGILNFITYFWGIDQKNTEGILGLIINIASYLMWLIAPVLAGTIAYSISGKVGIVPGIIGGIFANLGSGFIGAILIGIAAGYVTKWMYDYIKLPEKFEYCKTIILIPVISVLIIGLVMNYIFGPITEILYNWTQTLVKDLSGYNMMLVGAIIGIFVALDITGSFSKGALAGAFALVGSGIFVPQAAVISVAMVPTLGLALATVIARNKFTKEELQAGNAAWILGLGGVTEGAIPFVVSDPLRILPCTIVGSAIAGILAGAFSCKIALAKGGVFALTTTGAVSGIAGLILSIIVGVVVTALLVKFLKR